MSSELETTSFFDSDEDESYVVKGDIKKFSEFIEKNVKENERRSAGDV